MDALRHAPAAGARPREIFLCAVEQVAVPFIDEGWRFAKSGPHLTRRMGPLKATLSFSSSHYNSEESVRLGVALIVEDTDHGTWRRSLTAARRHDDVVQAANIGNLDTDNPQYFLCELVGTNNWSATIDEIIGRVRAVGGRIVDELTASVVSNGQDDVDPRRLVGLVNCESLVEYFLRFGHAEAATRLMIDQLESYGSASPLLAKSAREQFDEALRVYGADGLPDDAPHAVAATYAYYFVQFDLTAPAGGSRSDLSSG